MTGMMVWLSMAPMLVACGTEASESTAGEPKAEKQRSALWSCDVDSNLLTCTAALDASASAAAAYACKPDDSDVRCPDATALERVGALDGILGNAESQRKLASLTWACLVTGKNHFECTRDLKAVQATGAGTNGTGGESGGGTDTPTNG